MGEEGQNYTLRDIDHSIEDAQKVTFTSKATLTSSARTSAPTSAAAPKRHLTTRSTLARLIRLVGIGVPRSEALLSVGAIVLSVMAQARMLVQLTTHGSGMMSSIFKQDRSSFLRNWAAGVALSAGCAVTEQISVFFQSRLEVAMRQVGVLPCSHLGLRERDAESSKCIFLLRCRAYRMTSASD